MLKFSNFKPQLLGSAHANGSVGLWDIHAGKLSHNFEMAHMKYASSLSFSSVN